MQAAAAAAASVSQSVASRTQARTALVLRWMPLGAEDRRLYGFLGRSLSDDGTILFKRQSQFDKTVFALH